MGNVNKIVLYVLVFAFAKAIQAQQDPQYTQYMYNPIVINPAYAGNRGVVSIMGLHRSQWLGLEGAPRTQTLSIHAPVTDSYMGWGLSVVNDAIGPASETYVAGDFSYSIPVSDSAQLSFGFKGGFHVLDVNFGRLNPFDVNDPRLQDNIDQKIAPTVGIGSYYHTKNFYVGLSTPNLLETRHFNRDDTSATTFIERERIHIYGIAGWVVDINSAVEFKPATLVKAVIGAPIQVDFSANFLFNKKFVLGTAYRWNAALSGMAGFQLSDQLLVGFAYDREITELGNAIYNDGSYEVFLRFELFKNYDRMITPRFF